ncbi:hypothetical protein [Microbispora sp. CA-102843]|uniref:hypothetical protein n=1 Tax=Microbispora sp. CA-102843 TaxID=3239952 RepID=UPI003D8A46FE
MYEIRDDRQNLIDRRPTFEEAEQRLDEIARQATEQAAANAEGTAGMTLAWTIVDAGTGEVAATFSMTPDTTMPYHSAILDEGDEA